MTRIFVIVILMKLAEGWIMEALLPWAMMGRGW